MPADHACRTITGADEMELNEWDECEEIVKCVCVCSNANPVDYYVLRVPRKADKRVWNLIQACDVQPSD